MTPGPIYIDEPVALATIIKHFAQEDRMDWINQLSNAMLNNQMNGYVLEWQVIFLFLEHFGGVYTPIDHAFELSDLPEWSWLKDRKVTLVGVKHMGGSDYRSFSVNWDKAPHLPFGYDAPSGDKMASALERCNGTAFFRPDPFCHPDVLLTLRDEYGNLIGVLVQAKLSSGKGTIVSHISKAVFDKAVSSLEPKNIYSRKASEAPLGENGTPVKRPSQKVKNRVLQAFDKMLDATNGDTVRGASSLPRRNPRRSTRHQERVPPKWLRVLAIGPASADRYFGEEARKPHPYPLLLVKNERMVQLFGANWWNSTRQNVSVDPF
ncbi:uncharacterized protein STEHIDRAFT_172178 [Stereum hirsutum FP-91666 SS1]|uniref:uncharacterized protein n=1 Tax=Stereum hirsutum (strain FP-91666) TaxID=721885 RepID=UPI000444A8EF|nr:uncharacterized protein STEHIDRAFT_172178 [Stereum hirsutum FP-91666 SS1]EIM81172.1 hypothetical protein STEHIDRAFT_172178 [Stereum hirsutum FP-91666 SS1]